jgi:exportin-7
LGIGINFLFFGNNTNTYLGLTADKIQVKQDMYQEKYKGIMVAIQVLTKTLEGNYCCFGVFDIYKDSCLIDVVNIITKLSLQVQMKDIKAYPKFSRAFFAFLEVLFGTHIETTITFDSSIFLQLVSSFEDGITSEEISLSSQICGCLDKLCTFYFKSVVKTDQYSQLFSKHFKNNQILPKLLAQTLKIIIFEECRNQWSMSRAVMSLIATNPQFFEEIKNQIISSLPDSKKKQMNDAFTRLMDKVELDVEEGNKDKFTSNLITFKEETKQFL